MSRKKVRRKRGPVEILGFLAIGVFLVALVWLAFFTSPQSPQQTTRSLAPDFTLTDVDGNSFRLSDSRGKVVVINFMRTTCPHCVNEMPQLAAVLNRFGSKITMISISVDPGHDTDEVLKVFAAQYDARWIWARDTANVASQYRVSAVPMIMIVDPNGRIVNINSGETSESTLTQQIQAAEE